MSEDIRLDLEKTYAAILESARKHEFISYGKLAEANNVEWSKARRLMPNHLGQLVTIAHERGWPMPSAIVVNKDDLSTGNLREGSLDGFISAARAVGHTVEDPAAFVRDQQEKVFAWAPTASDNIGLPTSSDKPKGAGPRFVTYFGPVLDALRAKKGEAPAKDVYEWIRTHIEIPESEITGLNKGGQSKFEHKVGWARFYLSRVGLITSDKRGVWTLTSEGRETLLDMAQSLALFKKVQAEVKVTDDEDESPPEATSTSTELFDDPTRQFWFGGAVWDEDDQLNRFISEGIWQNGAVEDRYSDMIETMKPGDMIAIKSSFVQKNNLSFDVGGKVVSCMRIKAIGTITENLGDRRTVKVEWDEGVKPRDWYFYTYRTTLIKADPNDDLAKRLILFTFTGALQDVAFWLKQPYFARKYTPTPIDPVDDDTSAEDVPLSYTIDTIIEEGCFLSKEDLERALCRLKDKKNLILQGPPGTGKTWLAKRLGYALMGSKESKAVRSRLRVVQFHPSLSYEDFVRGWRPKNGGSLELVDGVFLSAVQAALSEPDIPHVFIIEEINRGNPAQVFGEMLTLLEDTKRRPEDSLELAYRREEGDDRIHIPPNLYIIGTMNIADRSLALVDLALRRRFAFLTLEPRFEKAWRDWCSNKGGFDNEVIAKIEERIRALNVQIGEERSLGPQYRIGHSYLTPPEGTKIPHPLLWFRQVVETEITPLLEEYWFDAMDKAQEAKARLLSGI
jgi:5-methylcytosine-specific restriction enzyme B